MRIKSIIFYAIWLLIFIILQPTLFEWIGVFGISPNVFLVFVVLTALLRGKRAGAVCGAVFGLVFDLLTGRMVGFSGIIFMYIGAGIGMAAEQFLNSSGASVSAVVLFVASFVYTFVYYIAYSMMFGDMGFLTALLRVILPEAVYNSLLGWVMFVPIRKSFGKIKRRNIY